MNRRGFLRGVLSALGAAAVGLPAVADAAPTTAEISEYSALLKGLYPAEQLPTLLAASHPFWSMLNREASPWAGDWTMEGSYAPFCRVRRSLAAGGWIEVDEDLL